mgnify:CR=1 FL=1
MTQRYDLCSPRPKRDGGTHWHKIGTAFPSDKGGFSMYFDSLPIPDKEGKVYVAAFEAKPRDGQRNGPPPAQGGGMDGDDIPFAPEVR